MYYKKTNKDKLSDLTKSLIDFYNKHGVDLGDIDQLAIVCDDSADNTILARTGNYDFKTQTITLFVDGRHIKDVMRTLAHELIHRNQHVVDPEQFCLTDKSGNLDDNPELERIEADAYMRGNLMFRKWTESMQDSGRELQRSPEQIQKAIDYWTRMLQR